MGEKYGAGGYFLHINYLGERGHESVTGPLSWSYGIRVVQSVAGAGRTLGVEQSRSDAVVVHAWNLVESATLC